MCPVPFWPGAPGPFGGARPAWGPSPGTLPSHASPSLSSGENICSPPEPPLPRCTVSPTRLPSPLTPVISSSPGLLPLPDVGWGRRSWPRSTQPDPRLTVPRVTCGGPPPSSLPWGAALLPGCGMQWECLDLNPRRPPRIAGRLWRWLGPVCGPPGAAASLGARLSPATSSPAGLLPGEPIEGCSAHAHGPGVCRLLHGRLPGAQGLS